VPGRLPARIQARWVKGMSEPGVAAAFFDQFPPLENAAEWPEGGQWCARHWAPAALLGANGIGAATELITIFVSEMAPPNVKSPAMLNRQLARAGRICCRLGDQRMYELWGRWPPVEQAGVAVTP
jgi:hypothetical protein